MQLHSRPGWSTKFKGQWGLRRSSLPFEVQEPMINVTKDYSYWKLVCDEKKNDATSTVYWKWMLWILWLAVFASMGHLAPKFSQPLSLRWLILRTYAGCPNWLHSEQCFVIISITTGLVPSALIHINLLMNLQFADFIPVFFGVRVGNSGETVKVLAPKCKQIGC